MNLASSSLGKRSAHEPEKTIRKDFHRGKTVQPIHQSKLYAVLAQSREDSVEFPLMLANHAPMVIIALDRLGASGRAIEKWYEMYHIRHNLTPVRGVPAPIDRGRWKEALGDRTREADYRDFFAGEVTKLGAVGAIRAYLPHLLQGVAGSATHPLMRLAYGIIAEDDNEIAVALGYWACCYLHLPEPTDAQPDTDDPAEVLAGIASIDGVLCAKPETDLLWHSIRAIGALPQFRPVVDRLAIGAETPRLMAETALALYLSTMDFAALHALTGLH
jgi:Questin oxidase-like